MLPKIVIVRSQLYHIVDICIIIEVGTRIHTGVGQRLIFIDIGTPDETDFNFILTIYYLQYIDRKM